MIDEETVIELLRRAECDLPKDVESALEKALEGEQNETARIQLKNILDNVGYAREKGIPICQDTGILRFYVKLGTELNLKADEVEGVIRSAVERATEEIPLRPNSVNPLTRENSGNIPEIEFEIIKDNFIEITAFPKGAGSENMSALGMFTPFEGINGIKKFVLEAVKEARGNPCPPTIVGVGVGGLSDTAMKLAKKSLLRKVGDTNQAKEIANLESELLSKINQLGIGPMGLGGSTTSLAVNIETAPCHTGSLPVAVNLQCWANRRAMVRILGDKVEWM